mmetsp:Transcript_4919/g.8319  ORF Transcript_4919/g.8319 Transcript_4919/m.8319 type:complete len:138 (-) Transcript_4919:301-714(-)
MIISEDDLCQPIRKLHRFESFLAPKPEANQNKTVILPRDGPPTVTTHGGRELADESIRLEPARQKERVFTFVLDQQHHLPVAWQVGNRSNGGITEKIRIIGISINAELFSGPAYAAVALVLGFDVFCLLLGAVVNPP